MSSELPQNKLSVAEARALLRDKFRGRTDKHYNDGWDELWNDGDFLPWDRMAPSPALTDTLDNWQQVIGTANLTEADGTKRRKRALVPGCGRGVDVLLLEAYGYDVVGLEYARKALEACEEYASEKAGDDMYKTRNAEIGRGSKKYVQGDFVSDEWLSAAGLAKDAKFEFIYDYTFFCAMDIARRPAWAKRMSELLAPGSQANLVCLEFPTTKAADTGGPPWSSPPEAYIGHLSHPGEEIPYTAEGQIQTDSLAESGPGGLERVGHWHPADAHAIGKGSEGQVLDYIAVWRHR